MTFEQWFDVNNREHLEAFQEKRETGYWPKGFIPNEYKYLCNGSLVEYKIMTRIVDRYCEKALAEKEPSKEEGLRKAPWNDSEGKELFEGDKVKMLDGKIGKLCFDESWEIWYVQLKEKGKKYFATNDIVKVSP